jgi:hypothetical protein
MKRVVSVAAVVLLVGAARLALGTGGAWVSQGPGPIQNGQTEGITNGLVIGAIHTLATNPSDADTLYVGTVNGGIWKTTNATAANPSWTPLTDAHPSLSIGALAFDPTDGTNQTLVAGVGRFSSLRSTGGPRAGLLRTIDGGSNWTDIGSLGGKNVSGLAARGATLVISADQADSNNCADLGVFRSTNTGGSFAQVIPGTAFDLASDPSSTSTLYTGAQFVSFCGGGSNGIYKSANTGASWTKVSDATIDALISDGGSTVTRNIKIAVADADNVYVGIVNRDPADGKNRLAGLFHTANAAMATPTWTALDLPSTTETTGTFGIHPGGQGEVHFALLADPTSVNRIYIDGDRQPAANEGMPTPTFPNSLGANGFTGRLFRGNAAAPSGSQWTSLTHSGTASNSAPHADGRRMVLDANGNLIEGCDGGVYRRTGPTGSAGDWFSVNGDLRATEMHDVAYDTLSNIIFGGVQDNGTSEQSATGSTTWALTSGGDGGDVAVDDSSATQSIRYESSQNLGGFRRRVYNAAGMFVSQTFPALTVTSGPALVPQFTTPVELNRIDPTRLVIVGVNSVYESLDQGDTIAEVPPGGTGPGAMGAALQNAVAYGGISSSVPNEDVLYVGVNDKVKVRTTSGGNLSNAAAYPGGTVRDVVLDTNEWMRAFVADVNDKVYQTNNAGGSWTDITGNLAALGARDFRTLEFAAGAPNDLLILGTQTGAYVSASNDFTAWDHLGTGLPNALLLDLRFDANDDLLAAGMLGRGAWTLSGITGLTITTTTSSTTTTTTLAPLCASTPASGCRLGAPGGSSVQLKDNLDDAKDQFKWKWAKGAVTDVTDFKDPVGGAATYRVCLYDSSANPQPLMEMDVPPGGTCGTKPCWKASGTTGFGFKSKAGTATGLTALKLKAGAAGKAQVQAKGKGVNLPMPTLGLGLPVTVQLLIKDVSSTECWQTTFTVQKNNDSAQFSAKGP